MLMFVIYLNEFKRQTIHLINDIVDFVIKYAVFICKVSRKNLQIDLERQENMRTNFSQSTSISLYIIYI